MCSKPLPSSGGGQVEQEGTRSSPVRGAGVCLWTRGSADRDTILSRNTHETLRTSLIMRVCILSLPDKTTQDSPNAK
ncbi:hypothetical protein E2C01_001018 [Portunus trituberculatus]|uniref:Uncharacterized protein n=1 Tax=Portunus trituberculatus TaxID=210409 RepID=A0A5B7CI69_PORTR|nr:hypothetical protein [Portunus trituberculatus]